MQLRSLHAAPAGPTLTRVSDDLGEPFLSMEGPPAPLTRVRSTLLVASLQRVRDAGLESRYLAALPAAHHAAMLEAVAGVWMPVHVALAHYRACDTLGLSVDDTMEAGRAVGEKVRGILLGTAARVTRDPSVTPWSVLPAFPRFWGRLFDGSAVLGWKLGPQEARLDVVAMPLCDTLYFRTALRGQALAVVELFCTRATAVERPSRAPGTLSVRFQWE